MCKTIEDPAGMKLGACILSHTTEGSRVDGTGSVSQGERVIELSYWTTAHGILYSECSKKKLLSYANIQLSYIRVLPYILYFTGLSVSWTTGCFLMACLWREHFCSGQEVLYHTHVA